MPWALIGKEGALKLMFNHFILCRILCFISKSMPWALIGKEGVQYF